MLIPRYKGSEPLGDDRQLINRVFDSLQPVKIQSCNWPAEYPYTPQVELRAFHDGANLYLRYDVSEEHTAALVGEDNGPVWTDSCVEFFVNPDGGKEYYNFEFNCIGHMLSGFHRSRQDADPASDETLATIKRFSTLPDATFAASDSMGPWSLIAVIPATALFRHDLISWSGKKMHANFYKCGDNLPVPHFLSLFPIDTPTPDFHRPEFFGEIRFEA